VLLQQSLRVKEATPHTITRKTKMKHCLET
jgi:hypothetical protein